jgi:hypothetical protein
VIELKKLSRDSRESQPPIRVCAAVSGVGEGRVTTLPHRPPRSRTACGGTGRLLRFSAQALAGSGDEYTSNGSGDEYTR